VPASKPLSEIIQQRWIGAVRLAMRRSLQTEWEGGVERGLRDVQSLGRVDKQ
jgi:hypothetical protein